MLIKYGSFATFAKYIHVYILSIYINIYKYICVCICSFFSCKNGLQACQKNRASRSSFGKLYFRASRVFFLIKNPGSSNLRQPCLGSSNLELPASI